MLDHLPLLFAGLLAASTSRPGLVVVISIDALHPAAVTAKTMPNVARLGQLGRMTLDGHSTRPPNTLVAHTAMLTGLDPRQSGKVDNAWEEGQSLAPLFSELERRGSYFLVVTSDHAGHEREHGSDDPEDGRLPLVVRSAQERLLPDVQGKRYEISSLRSILAPAFIGARR